MGVDMPTHCRRKQSRVGVGGRTYLFDKFVAQEIDQARTCGESRRWTRREAVRMALLHRCSGSKSICRNSYLQRGILANEKPVCALERVRTDLSDGGARRALFADLDRRANRILILTEGLLIYLSAEEVLPLPRTSPPALIFSAGSGPCLAGLCA